MENVGFLQIKEVLIGVKIKVCDSEIKFIYPDIKSCLDRKLW